MDGKSPSKSTCKSPTKKSQFGEGTPSNRGMQGLTEKEVEIESLKTVIVALNEKVKVIESIQDDVKNA